MSQNAKTANGLVKGLLNSSRAFVLGTALLAGSMTMLSTTHAQAEKILRVGNDGEPQSMDPHFISTVQTSRLSDDMFLGLLTYGPDGEPVPGAAESWTVSDDGMTYTFKIRDHNWSDGVPVTAGDFVAGWNRLLDPATGAEYASLLYIIEGAEAVNSGKEGAKLAATALDDKTLQVKLTAPAPYFLAQLTHQTAFPIPQHAIAKFGKDWVKPENIVVNGPYKLTEWLPNVHSKLEKNAEFYDAANVPIDEVIYYTYEDRTAMQNRFRAGELDVARDIASEQISWLRDNLADSLRIAPYAGIYYYAIRTDKDMFKDVRVRKALSMAINREAITDSVLKTGELPAYSFVPPGTGNYGEPAYISWKDLSYNEKLEEAKKLLAEAGYGPDNPLKFTLRYNTSENHKRIAIAAQNMWKQIGVQAELFNTEGKIHYADLKVGNFEVARAGWIADYNDAQNFLFLGEERTGPLNYAAFDNPRYNELMLEAEKEGDLKKRASLMKQAEAIMMEAQPYIPIYYYVSKQLVSPKIEGWIDNAPDRHLTRWLDIKE
ncbi:MULTISPECIES: peptide ABC transporter substrate-binding protein [Thalassospira]|jgi:oligopeptide transport system substrate-binding protein|uniref:Peptide ABC transporter substrate-binding protein n=1 Tax=Thalassospira xiamenensis TaxID=220697 RepID=A0ABR5Y1C0_9PROT|nr:MULTISPECIES: peptide ABC transporter substrate-binding protein [Thalassospira]KZD02855.1 peptide ABC transporter substrate-binding protein [Thalassospira xiamenensis]KZD06311.1 peptide ABC transporter substrate-binding protein [Thalassospira xiamenensis]MAB33487.1 peptide ABC transporter substrate-binding protein [Thalassospira sp.]MAL28837.1 peptide ABC transporter substrate-binding protein [Thalassospira sp.]MCD1596609.1 peptide ABC transporter substrate-binding protein [Thalassospira xi|tara:strand:+ start:3140 stop:4774 length:1635 start_codon:yes stop_codon:yes gene_type:complete